MEKTDGESSLPLFRDDTLSRVSKESMIRLAIPAGTIIGPVSEVHIVEILSEYDFEVGVP